MNDDTVMLHFLAQAEGRGLHNGLIVGGCLGFALGVLAFLALLLLTGRRRAAAPVADFPTDWEGRE